MMKRFKSVQIFDILICQRHNEDYEDTLRGGNWQHVSVILILVYKEAICIIFNYFIPKRLLGMGGHF